MGISYLINKFKESLIDKKITLNEIIEEMGISTGEGENPPISTTLLFLTFKELLPEWDRRQIRRLWQFSDHNHNGYVDFHELEIVAGTQLEALPSGNDDSIVEKVRDTCLRLGMDARRFFQLMDKNGDGYIDMIELKLGFRRQIPEKELSLNDRIKFIKNINVCFGELFDYANMALYFSKPEIVMKIKAFTKHTNNHLILMTRQDRELVEDSLNQ